MRARIILILATSLTIGSAQTLKDSLARSKANKAELEKALSQAKAKKKQSLEFLISYMPTRDLESLSSGFLLENLQLAYQARETFPWGKRIDDATFNNDVLPYAILNEKREAWRKDFYNRFSVMVKDCKTVEEAITAINKQIKQSLKVKYSTKRKKPDQSPSESIEQGLASCTGLSILLVDAYRSVGIPARIAGTPAWTTKRGNHNWVEVFTPSDKQWHFTEYYANAKGLDKGWFVKDASQANKDSLYHSIYATSWKTTGQHFPLVWDLNIRYVNALNVTARYNALAPQKEQGANLCELRVSVHNAEGHRVPVTVKILQGDAIIGRGVSPKPTDDNNHFFTVGLKKGQLYQASWIDPDTKKSKQRMLQIPKDKPHYEIILK